MQNNHIIRHSYCHIHHLLLFIFFFFFNDTATTEIYTLSLHDALPISCTNGPRKIPPRPRAARPASTIPAISAACAGRRSRSEEHTSELQSRRDLVCRLLLEKKKKKKIHTQKKNNKRKKK